LNTADLVLLAFLALAVLVGVLRGFVRMLYRLASTVVSFLIFLFLAPPVAAAIQGFPVFDAPRAALRDFLLQTAAGDASQSVASVVGSLEASGLPAPLREILLAGFPDTSVSLSTAMEPLSAALFLFLLTAVVGLVLFVVASILLLLATAAVEAVLHKVKVLDGANHLAGGVLGLAEGALTVFVLLGLLALAAPWLPEAVRFVEDTTVLAFLYHANPLFALLSL
jgi:uncharacterized membrane protein required for colicin V production